jgi:RNA polymerase sigma factor (sigma-70 family)
LTAVLAYIETLQNSDWYPLIDGCKRNESASQEKLYKTMYPKMMSMVRRYVDNHNYQTAEEILNNGFLKVFQKIDTYKFEGSFEGWVRRIIFNSMSDYIRSNIKYMKKTVFVEKDEVIDNNITHKLGYEELLKIVQTLPDTSRIVFNMFAIEGFSHKEIADTIGISEGTSKWHLFEARKFLKAKLDRR